MSNKTYAKLAFIFIAVVLLIPAATYGSIITDKDFYFMHEEVNIKLAEHEYSEIIIEHENARYRFMGDSSDMVFVPELEGEYIIRGLYGEGEETLKFYVGEENIEVSNNPDIKLSDSKGKIAQASIKQVLHSEEFDFEIIPDSMIVKKIKVKSAGGEAEIILDELSKGRMSLVNANAIKGYAISTKNLDSESSIYGIAQGNELYECQKWSFQEEKCLSSWNKKMDLNPGQEYEIEILPGEYAFMEVGVASINSVKPIYRPGETAELYAAVVDRHGKLTSDVEVNIKVTSPLGDEYAYDSESGVHAVSKGIFFVLHYVEEEGKYNIEVSAQGPDTDAKMFSSFYSAEYYWFEITRESPLVIDPDFETIKSRITVEPYIDAGIYSITEIVPGNFSILDSGDSEVEKVGDEWHLTWKGLFEKATVQYEALPPSFAPYIYKIGPAIINFASGIFIEARSWFVAIDPYFYYDPSTTISSGWTAGTGTTYAEIDDGIRYNSVPDINNYVASPANANAVSQFGLPNITNPRIENMTLWVYTGTGSNAQYTFELRQGGTTRCSTFMATSSPTQWYSCSWTNPSGDFSDMRIHLGGVTKSGGGQNQNAFVYAAYVQVFQGEPPQVTLNSPANNSLLNNSFVNFNFTATDDIDVAISNCSLWSNFTGTWSLNRTITSVTNGTERNISVSVPDGAYIWNVECSDSKGHTNSSQYNWSVSINNQTPIIAYAALNASIINQSWPVRFNASITDSYGISSANLTILYPNGTSINYTLSNTGNEYYYTFTETIQLGTYNVTLITAFDAQGQIGQNTSPGLSFTVTPSPPGPFNLVAPPNLTVSKNRTPVLEWEQTQEDDFDNYTIIISENQDFSSPAFVYNTFDIDNTTLELSSMLAPDVVYYWMVTAYDIFSNARNSSQYFIYETDNTNPDVSLNMPGNNNYVLQQEVTFNYTAYDLNILSCELYGNFSGLWQTNETNSSIANGEPNYFNINLEEGIYLWNVLCSDAAANVGYNSNNLTFIIDMSPPAVNLVSPENETYENSTNNIAFVYNTSDRFADIDSCILIIDGAEIDSQSSVPQNQNVNFTRFVSNGEYYWSVNCTDSNGFENASETRLITINVTQDFDPPTISLNYPDEDEYVAANSVNFSFTPSDATGIDNCSIYINGTLNDTMYDIQNFIPNYFNYTGLQEGMYNWTVECYDNSTNNNYYIAPVREFTIDTIYPEVLLNSPENSTFTNSTTLFNYTPSDINLDACSLYGNFSGVWALDQTNTTPTSGEPNYFQKTLLDGTYVWNVLCIDFAGLTGYYEYNLTFSIDTSPPEFYNITAPSSPAEYSPSISYGFNITWLDNFGVNRVLLESNFSGTLNNQTLQSPGSGVYNFSTPSLRPGTYSYKWYANDTRNNRNETGQFFFVINKSQSDIQVLLNGSNSNFSINENQYVNITGDLINPSSGQINMYMNGVLLNSGNAPVNNITYFEIPGAYNITAEYGGNENYTYSSDTMYVIVNDTTGPVVSLISPENNSLIGNPNVPLSYNVTDYSDILNCSLYINGFFNDSDNSITKNVQQVFVKSFADGNYSWQVRCIDEYMNEGQSETRNFTVQESTTMNVSVSTDKESYEEGEYSNITTNVTDVFGQAIYNASITTDIILGNASSHWWNSSWKKRKQIQINETSGAQRTNSIIEVNITGISVTNCVNEIRIIKNGSGGMEEIQTKIYAGDNSTWCTAAFRINMSASESSSDYFVYYNNTAASNPLYADDMNESKTYFAQVAAADSGTPTNVNNIIGFNDATSATMAVSGGGGQTVAAHGRAFINQTQGYEIRSVNARYRYEVPTSTATWNLRYSVNDGSSYSTAFTGSTTRTKQTTNWVDLTSFYSSLSWTELNRTRLQGSVTKPTGGSAVTLNLFWVELNVTYKGKSENFQSSTGEEQQFIERNSDYSSLQGISLWNWSTLGKSYGNYSVVSFVQKEGFINSSASDYFSIVPDVTPPQIFIAAPEQGLNTSLNYMTFNWTAFDYAQVSYCNLTINGVPNQTNIPITNWEYYNITVSNLQEGVYNWNITCADPNFNSVTSETRNFTVDFTPPNVTLNSPVEGYNTSNTSIIFNWTAHDVFSPVVSCIVLINGNNVSGIIESNASEQTGTIITDIQKGTYSWSVNCTDIFGNSNTSASRNFFVIGAPDNIAISMLVNNSFMLSWDSLLEADYYNIYFSENYTEGFSSSANVTGITGTSYIDDSYSLEKRFYKISGVRGEEEKMSDVSIGKFRKPLLQGVNLISAPLNIYNYALDNGANDGFNFSSDEECIVSLWKYSPSSGFKRTDWVSGAFVPASGSEDFTSINDTEGYWLETNSDCNITLYGEVPSNNFTKQLLEGYNLVSWLSAEDKKLPTEYEEPLISTIPSNSVNSISRYNSEQSKFEVTVFYFDEGTPWGWFPSIDNPDFTHLESTRGYYMDTSSQITWEHKP